MHEYSFRVVVRAKRPGEDTPEHRHHLVRALRRVLMLNGDRRAPYVVDVCEIRDSRAVPESEMPRRAIDTRHRRPPPRHVRP